MPVKHATSPEPGLLAQLNSAVLSLMDQSGVRNVARPLHYFDAHPEQALASYSLARIPSIRIGKPCLGFG